MAKMRWVYPYFKGEDSSEKCPATAGNRAGKGGSSIQKGRMRRGVVFYVGIACCR